MRFEQMIKDVIILINKQIAITKDEYFKSSLTLILKELDEMHVIKDNRIFKPTYPQYMLDCWTDEQISGSIALLLMDILDIYDDFNRKA